MTLPRSVIEKRYRRQLNERRKRKARLSEPALSWSTPRADAQAKPHFLDENVLRRTIALFMSKGLR
jgi:hypothetical protein